MFIGIRIGVPEMGGGVFLFGNPASFLNPALLRVGDQVGGAYVAGTYTYGGQAVTLGTPVYTVNGNAVAANYVLQVGDLVAAAAIPASVGATPIGTVYAEPTDVTDFSYTTSDFEYIVPAGNADVVAPTLVSSVPADNATNIAIDTTIQLIFSEAVTFGTGLITLRGNSGGFADVETFDVETEVGTGPGQVSVVNDTVTIRPTSPLVSGREYAIRVAATAIKDASGNFFAGIANDTTLSFTAIASAAPTLSSQSATPLRGKAATLSVTTDTADGTLYVVITNSATSPSAAQIIAGQDHTGAAALYASSQAISSTGAKTFSPTAGLTPGATHHAHFVHRSAASVDSNRPTDDMTMHLPTLVGQKIFSPTRNSTDNTISLSDLTGGIAAAPSADDLVCVAYATGSIANRSIGVVAADGYTTFVAKIYQNNTEDLNFYTGYKVMGSTPDTQVTVTGTLNSADAGAIVIQVWRYIDPVTPLDVAVVGTSGSGGQPVFGAITPTSTRARILCMGGGAGVTCVDFTSSDLSNFLPFTGNGTHDAACGMGSFDWTSGAFTAATWGGGEAGAGNARAAVAAALRPY